MPQMISVKKRKGAETSTLDKEGARRASMITA